MGLWSNGYDVCFTLLLDAEGSQFEPGQTHFLFTILSCDDDYRANSVQVHSNYVDMSRGGLSRNSHLTHNLQALRPTGAGELS